MMPPRRSVARSTLTLMLLGLSAAGCIKEPENEFYVRFGMTEQNILASGHAMQRPVQPVTPLYCYRTIGVVDCSALPETGAGARLVGHFGPPPF